ncbi:MAG TPA: prepilin-type N-terminal cleavage/methylation domain-containing protein [Candidatus Angelobacter sp.]|nr:prepilin-type N-terminal cleavage/methylation domain-containing protein [Candidatus Angelobacter sp.]
MKRKNKGFSLIELLIVVAIILIIAAIAIPNLLRSKASANEAAAVAVLRNVHNSQAVYIVQFTSAIGYADSLIKLGPGTPCDANHACLSDQLVGCAAEPCIKSGYMFYMTSSSASAPFGDYTSTATPVSWNNTGTKNYCTADDGVVRYQKTASASVTSAITHPNCMDITQFTPLGG